MSSVDVINAEGTKAGSVELPDDIFDVQANIPLMHQVVVAQLAAARQGTAKVKSRGEVAGGGKKPYKQKGTGRPQVGSSRTPLWRKGGTVFGPQPRSYEFSLPKKVRVGAVRAALSQKLSDGAVIVVDKLETADGKTKGTAEMLKRWGVSGKALVIDVKPDEKFTLSARNIDGVHLVAAARVTARDIIDTAHVIATREALEKLQESLA